MKKTVEKCNGCFDGLHPGHLFFLGFACAHGDELVVGINSDEYIARRKGKVLVPVQERVKALMGLGIVKKVVIFDDDPRCFIRQIHPDVHCTGYEYREGKAIEDQLCKDMGIRLVFVPRVGEWSSTILRNSSE